MTPRWVLRRWYHHDVSCYELYDFKKDALTWAKIYAKRGFNVDLYRRAEWKQF